MLQNTTHISQADVRTVRIFKDQHGRKWKATVNNHGVHPGHPVSPLTPMFKAPIYPTKKYIRYVNVPAGEIEVDYERWIEDKETSIREYTANLYSRAALLNISDPEQVMSVPGTMEYRKLHMHVGDPPSPIEQILACREGHPYALGLDDRLPKSLRAFFPSQRTEPQTKRFLTFDEEVEQLEQDGEEWPRKTFGGGYTTSDGEEFKGAGAKARAEQHQASLTVEV